MYQHADQSWKNKPRTLSVEHQNLFIERLSEYVQLKQLKRILIVYHGGEPLLFGTDNIVALSSRIQSKLNQFHCTVDFGIQTNGVILKESHLDAFQEHNISVSLSIDGPKEMHDQHRLDLKGRPSFDKVYASLNLLKKYPKIFTGCIAVINPHFPPNKLLEFFNENDVREFNLLIPDANYLALPKDRAESPDLYKNWLIEAFDCWFDHYSHLKCKYFDWLIRAVLGFSSPTDSFGLGDISLLVLETDGTYHNHDVLKITEEGNTSLGMGLESHPIAAVEQSEIIQFHRHLLTIEGLSGKCQNCKHVNVCGGGFIAHRYNKNGYCNPTVYCEEMYALIDHISSRLVEQLKPIQQKKLADPLSSFGKSEMSHFFDPETSDVIVSKLQDYRSRKNHAKLLNAIPYALTLFPEKSMAIEIIKDMSFEELKPALIEPTFHAWLRAFHGHSIKSPAKNVDDQELPLDPTFFEKILELANGPPHNNFVIQSQDRWYRYSMGTNIILEHDEDILEQGKVVLLQALDIIKEWNHALYFEMAKISPKILLVKDTLAHPDKDVSFSDITLPGTLFIGVWSSTGLHSPYVIAASLIHEHLHQKLYLLQSRFEMFLPQSTLIYSPWPKTMRPPQGVLHAVYVFSHVAQFWQKMLETPAVEEMASEHLKLAIPRLEQCINDIRSQVKFTEIGHLLFDRIDEEFNTLNTHQLVSKS
jgi:uncharacterized protein